MVGWLDGFSWLALVGCSIGWLVGWFVGHNFLKVQENYTHTATIEALR